LIGKSFPHSQKRRRGADGNYPNCRAVTQGASNARLIHSGPMYYLSMLTAIAGLVTYQLFMRAAPRGVNPWGLMAMVYFIAGTACVVAAAVWRRFVAPAEPLPGLTSVGAAALIAVSVILIEIGYLLVYRAGWSISIGPGVAQAVTLSLLFLVGVTAFGERFTIGKLSGVLLCLGGLWLLVREG
jgi:hypothetical protein